MGKDLMEKLMVSKAIMDRHNNMPRNSTGGMMPTNINMNTDSIPQNYTYNIPEQMAPKENVQANSFDKIKQSKLPDAIKQIMIEHPIQQPQQNQTVFSEEFIEKASRLMNKKENKSADISSSIDYNLLKKIIKETVEETLKENNMLLENVQKTNDIFSFKVGKHIFEGKITKIKKLS